MPRRPRLDRLVARGSGRRLESGLRTIVDFERGARDPRDLTKDALFRALELGGVLFLDAGSERNGGPGVRLQKGNSGQTIPLEDLSAANDE